MPRAAAHEAWCVAGPALERLGEGRDLLEAESLRPTARWRSWSSTTSPTTPRAGCRRRPVPSTSRCGSTDASRRCSTRPTACHLW